MKEEPEIYHTPFGSTIIPPYDYTPETIDITTIDSPITRTIPLTGWSSSKFIPPKHWTMGWSWEDDMKRQGKEKELTMNIRTEKFRDEYIVYCSDARDLSLERILLAFDAVKGKLLYEAQPVHVKDIQCKMTPIVKNRIIEAGRRLKRYGKKSPVISSFDEYGNRLPDEIEISYHNGVSITIVDPEVYGPEYLELKAIMFPQPDYSPDWDTTFPF